MSVARATRGWEPTQILRGSLDQARRLVRDVSSVVVLTGAGISTDSGVPDYRGPGSLRATPMLYEEFVSDGVNQRRYWARSYQGFARVQQAQPNAGHLALSRWEHRDSPCQMVGVITQNVDGLHRAAGTRRLINLHGRIADVVCLDCAEVTSRAELQTRMARLNPDVVSATRLEHAELRPDGDAMIDEWSDFVVPDCSSCAGVLKPDVVFFGEPVPADRVATAYEWCDRADALVVAGSSLTVMSGLRFARRMAKLDKPVIIVNQGATRADELATVRLDASTSQVLPALL